MTFRQGNSSSNDRYSKPKSRLNQQIRSESTDEGCPVMEESGTICGETDTFDVFQEFRNIYEDCLKKLEGTEDGNATLRKLAPFKKLIDDLWEQNTMLVETVEELEQEATCRVTNLQDKLNKSCQKMSEFEEDIQSLVKIIQSLCKHGVYNPVGLKLHTLCPASLFGSCKKSCSDEDEVNKSECDTCGEKFITLENSTLPPKASQKRTNTNCNACKTSSLSSFLSDCSDSNTPNVIDTKKIKFLDTNCSQQSFDQNSNAESNCDCQECAQPINIHCNINHRYSFNIGNLDSCECDCSDLCALKNGVANN